MSHHDLCVNVLGDYGGRYLVSCCECMVNMYITETKRSSFLVSCGKEKQNQMVSLWSSDVVTLASSLSPSPSSSLPFLSLSLSSSPSLLSPSSPLPRPLSPLFSPPFLPGPFSLSSLCSHFHFTNPPPLSHTHKHGCVHRTLVDYSPTPSTAQLLLSAVQEMWKRMERDPSSVSKDEVPFSYKNSAVAAFACHPGQLLFL